MRVQNSIRARQAKYSLPVAAASGRDFVGLRTEDDLSTIGRYLFDVDAVGAGFVLI